ncbi:MAG: mandelate racemase/muconate lactonizing enzyme family protein [Planctomycetota bacterium]|nr:mandelate racemase/muconate lactonizing enzyme family protein [Planctomycetota bacterium]
MNIVRVESFVRDRFGLVRLTREDGAQGWGQMAHGDPDVCATLLHRYLAPVCLGHTCTGLAELTQLLDACEFGPYKSRGTHLIRALAGIDSAGHDLLATAAGVPVCRLLGGEPMRLPVYASSLKRDTRPADEVDTMLRYCEQHGVSAVKLKVGHRLGRHRSEDAGRTEALIPLAAAAFGDRSLKVDANGSYTAEEAITVGRLLEQNGYDHYEEPCPYWRFDDTRAVTEALEIPVAGGEQDCCDAVLIHQVTAGCVDIIQPDVGYLGGLRRSLAVAAVAAQHDMPCMPHAPNPSLLFPMSMHLSCAMPNRGAYLERNANRPSFDIGMYTGLSPLVDGAVTVDDTPGWGVTIRDDWLSACQHQQSQL